MKRVPEVVWHFVHELSPPSHEHSESLPEGQALLQAPDGGGDGASPICHCCVLSPSLPLHFSIVSLPLWSVRHNRRRGESAYHERRQSGGGHDASDAGGFRLLREQRRALLGRYGL